MPMHQVDLLPWNPEADSPLAKRSVISVGTMGHPDHYGAAAYVGVTSYGHSHELVGGRLTKGQLGRLLAMLAEIHGRLPDGGPGSDG